MTEKSVGIACELYEIILDKLNSVECSDLAKADIQLTFGKYLVNIKDYEKANGVLKEALRYSEERTVSRRNSKLHFDF